MGIGGPIPVMSPAARKPCQSRCFIGVHPWLFACIQTRLAQPLISTERNGDSPKPLVGEDDGPGGDLRAGFETAEVDAGRNAAAGVVGAVPGE